MTTNMTSKSMRVKIISFWIFTSILALQVAIGSIMDLSRNQSFIDIASHLGYPAYLLTILGVLRIPAFIFLLIPKFPLLKEWTYVGLFFEFFCALISHIAVGDTFSQCLSPTAFIIIVFASWLLRPKSMKLA